MRTGATRTIGLAMSAISNPYFGDVVHSIEELLTQQDYSLLLADTHDNPDSEKRAIGDLLRQRPTGIILAPSAHPGDVLTAVAARKIPLVCIDRVIPGIDSVGVENENSGAKTSCTSDRPRAPTDFNGRRPAGADHHRGTSPRLHHTNGAAGAGPGSVLHGDSRGSGARRSSRPRWPARTADRPGRRQQPDDHRRDARTPGCRAVGARRSRAGGVRRLRVERPVQPPAHRSCATRKEMASTAVSLLLDRMADPGRGPRQIRLSPSMQSPRFVRLRQLQHSSLIDCTSGR